jgi:hypothetical protein
MELDMRTHAKGSRLSRRQILRLAGLAPAAALASRNGLLLEPLLAASGRPIAGYNPAWLPDSAQLQRWLKQLHDFGPIRATGTPQARAFEEWLATQVTGLGFSLERDQYKLTSWECDVAKDCAIAVAQDGGTTKNLEVVAYYPFCGSTRGKAPITGRVVYIPNGNKAEVAKAFADQMDPKALAESIVVIDMPLSQPAGSDYSRIKWYSESFPADPPPDVNRPNPANQGGRAQMELFEHRARALVLCTNDVSNDTARFSYLPFSDQHRTIPCLFVGAEGSRYLQSVSGKGMMTLRCDATLTPNARADSLAATMKGQSDEVIFLTTHTDGPNEVNDNGALGVLALATYWNRMPAADRHRTLFLSLPTGHYAGGAIADKVTGSGERAGTGGVMSKRPDVVRRTVAQIQLEQMGSMEWIDQNGTYAPTGKVARQRWIPTPSAAPVINRLFMAATETESPKFANSRLVESGSAPGEGGGLRSRNIPGIGLMGSPSFFFRVDPKGVIDKLNPDVMHFEASIAAKLMVLFNRLSVDQLQGKAPISDKDVFGV